MRDSPILGCPIPQGSGSSGGRGKTPEGVSSSTLKAQLLAMSTLPSHPLVPSPGVVLVTAGENRLTGAASPTLQQGTGRTIACPWLVPHYRRAPGLQAGRREGRTDEGWTEGKEG